MRDTPYATEIATVEDAKGARIERLHVKSSGQDEIRFSWWKDGKMAMRPLDLPEEDLLPLLVRAIDRGLFSSDFLNNLSAEIQQKLMRDP